MNTRFSKSDFWKAVIAGEAIALLAMPVLKNLKIFDLIRDWNSDLFSCFIILCFIFFPAATVAGLYAVYASTIAKWPMFFQMGKYGIVGLLNVFLFAGIINFLVWRTGIAKGVFVDLFAAFAFILTTVNSFLWNRFWTFNARRAIDIKWEYVRFFIITTAVSLFNIGLMHLMINVVGTPENLDLRTWLNMAVAVTIPVSFFGNFFGYRIFVFKENKI